LRAGRDIDRKLRRAAAVRELANTFEAIASARPK
jgi:hypothetical protein